MMPLKRPPRPRPEPIRNGWSFWNDWFNSSRSTRVFAGSPRRRGRGPAAGQEDQAAVAALRRRAVADRGGHAVRDLPGPAQPVLHHGRGRGRPRRRQPGPADHPDGSSCGRRASCIIITHQKRTMEVADALYGVTMRAGVTQVISQRLNRDGDRRTDAAMQRQPARGPADRPGRRAAPLGPGRAAGSSGEYGLATGRAAGTAMQLGPATGRRSPARSADADWMAGVATRLPLPAAEAAGRGRASGRRTAATSTPRCSPSSARYAPPAARSASPPTPPTCSTATWPRSAWRASSTPW